MPIGTVKWFNNAKGFGFLLGEDDSSDIFAHYSAIEMDGYKTLNAGQQVEYELVEGDKGQHAAHIRRVEQKLDIQPSNMGVHGDSIIIEPPQLASVASG